MTKATVQNGTIAVAAGAAAFYAWKSQKGIAMGALIVIGACVAGWIVGGYAGTVQIIKTTD